MFVQRTVLKHNLPILKKLVYSQVRCSAQATAKSQEIIIDVDKRLPAKKPMQEKREPFVKNLFLGKFDYEFLDFFEPQTDTRYNEFMPWLQKIKEYVEQLNIKEIERTGIISPEIYKQLAEYGVFGARIHEDYKGMNLLVSEFSRLIETLGYVPGLAQVVLKQGFAPIQLFNKYGSVEQKWEYLPKIATGNALATFCLTEPNSGPTAKKLESSALLSKDDKYWSLNGTKTFVSNGDIANVFIVLAHGMKSGSLEHRTETITSFIVDRDQEGVIVKEPTKLIGLPGFHTCTVIFKDVKVPVNKILGKYGEGSKQAVDLFVEGRHLIACQAIAILRKLIFVLTNEVLNRKHFNKNLFEYDSTQQVISKVACSLYGLESMLYLTTAAQDLFTDQDLAIESALVESYCADECLRSIIEGTNLLGVKTCVEDGNFKQFILDIMTLVNYETSIKDTKIFSGLVGMHHYGKEMSEYVRKLRNPFLNPNLWKNIFRKQNTLKLYLEEHLHPSLAHCAETLDSSLFKFNKSVETLIIRHGMEIGDRHMDLERITDMAMYIYAYTAMISRASRSYCIGNKNSDYEVRLALCMLRNLIKKADLLAEDILYSEFANGDSLHKTLAQKHFENKSYFAEHPLTRNW